MKFTHKLLILISIIFQLSCKKEIVKKQTHQNEIAIDIISTGNGYGKILKKFQIIKKTDEYFNYKDIIYYTLKINGVVDTIKIHSLKKIVFRNKVLKIIDTKLGVRNDGEKIEINKYYLSHQGNIAADDYADLIFYISNDGIIASSSTTSNFILFYEPNKYSNFQKTILNKTANFKKHKNEI